jgi:lantibiotic transport system permease protein
MIALTRAISAETLKLKRTLALWLAFITPLAIVGLMFAANLMQQSDADPGFNAWDGFSDIIFVFWALLMLPLFITLETALLSELESSEKHWKHLFALPIPRAALYLAKLLVGAGLIALSSLVLWGAILLAGYALHWLKPEGGFGLTIPWLETLRTAFFSYLAGWLILALHTWISLRWRSFTMSVGVGMIATVIGVFITVSSEKWSRVYPWALPSMAMGRDSEIVLQVLALAVIGAIVVTIAGCWDMIRQDVL